MGHESPPIVEMPDSVTHRCPICDWLFASNRDGGCVLGDCSYRPNQYSQEWYRIQQNRSRMVTEPLSLPSRDTTGA
jgi:hypothetical protein